MIYCSCFFLSPSVIMIYCHLFFLLLSVIICCHFFFLLPSMIMIYCHFFFLLLSMVMIYCHFFFLLPCVMMIYCRFFFLLPYVIMMYPCFFFLLPSVIMIYCCFFFFMVSDNDILLLFSSFVICDKAIILLLFLPSSSYAFCLLYPWEVPLVWVCRVSRRWAHNQTDAGGMVVIETVCVLTCWNSLCFNVFVFISCCSQDSVFFNVCCGVCACVCVCVCACVTLWKRLPWKQCWNKVTGSVVFQMARKYNMVIVSSILERDEGHGEILANTAGEHCT